MGHSFETFTVAFGLEEVEIDGFIGALVVLGLLADRALELEREEFNFIRKVFKGD